MTARMRASAVPQVRRKPETWAEVRDWNTDREMMHAASLWRDHFWAKGAVAFLIAFAVTLPIALLVCR